MPKATKKFRKFYRIIPIFLIGLPLFVVLCNWGITQSTQKYLFSQVKKVPRQDVALVLGTAARLSNGNRNLFFEYRMNAAAKLYKNRKVKHFILSGDNHRKGYDEPSDMKKGLIARGVPASKITLDYAGFRTFDSIIRAKKIFGQQKFVIVSQPFHNERAVFIARAKGIEAYGYHARAISRKYGFKVYLREYFARVKAVLDVYILGTKPKFLGKKEVIRI